METTVTVVYWGHTIELNADVVSALRPRHKEALARQIAYDMQVLRQMQEVAPILVTNGGQIPTAMIQERMATLSFLVPGREEEMLDGALDQFATWSGDGSAIQALLLSTGMI